MKVLKGNVIFNINVLTNNVFTLDTVTYCSYLGMG